MKIYTKTGDGGETGLFGGRRVSKNSVRIEAYGTVDELNASIGLANSAVTDARLRSMLMTIQHTLFVLGSDLATPLETKNVHLRRISETDVKALELQIDTLEAELEPLRNFILPGGTEASSRLHVCRTICRRAERCIVQLDGTEDINTFDIHYINRLSDFLFVLARYANHAAGQPDIDWQQE
ncbi:MAG: ATP:cob(I)alamin adenosyltransferase [Ignavibacteria bacterium]|nr:MAG: ATP:cob(I)alamin adenosyltransferase [Ignavibacteria bacterium]